MSLVGLKLLGFVFMTIDHIGIVIDFFPFRIVGRLAFPIFAFLVANGIQYTHDKKRYFLRLLLLAIVSEIPYDLFNYGRISFETQNVFFTLLLGGLCIYIYEKIANFDSLISILSWFIPTIFGFISAFLFFDYGYAGVMIIFVYYAVEKTNLKVLWLFILPVLAFTFDGLGVIGCLSLLFINAYKPDKLFNKKINKWLYAVYPVQYLILFVVRCLI